MNRPELVVGATFVGFGLVVGLCVPGGWLHAGAGAAVLLLAAVDLALPTITSLSSAHRTGRAVDLNLLGQIGVAGHPARCLSCSSACRSSVPVCRHSFTNIGCMISSPGLGGDDSGGRAAAIVVPG